MKKFKVLVFFICLLLISCKKQTNEWQGYVEGRYLYVSSQFAGVLKNLFVERGTYVRKDHPLLVLEPQPESSLLLQAEANVKEAEANKQSSLAAFKFSGITQQRDMELYKKNALQKAEVDSAQSEYDKNKANVDQMEAALLSAKEALDKARWTADQKTLLVPKDGLVFDVYFRVGELVAPNQAILSLLSPEDIKVIFYITEIQLGQIKTGQSVKVECDGCARAVTAKISFISSTAEYTPPVIYSNEARSKLVFRVEAEASLKEAALLHPGQPVRVALIMPTKQS